MEQKLDAETKKVLTDAENLQLMTEHAGWGIARQKLVDKINDLQFIQNVDKTSPEKALLDITARQYAVDILFGFLKEDIEGSVDQHITNNNLPKPLNSIIVRQA